MNSCWYEAPDERPSFSELAKELESILSSMVGYMELGMTLTVAPEDDHGEKYADMNTFCGTSLFNCPCMHPAQTI